MGRLFRFSKYVFFNLIMLTAAIPLLADETAAGFTETPRIEDGIYENNGHFFVIKDDRIETEVLKSFYGFWYDGEYPLEEAYDTSCLAQMEDKLYLDWWQRIELQENVTSGGVFWAPGSNIREYALDPYPVKERLSGWFIIQNSASENEGTRDLIYEIPYWKADVEYSDELAFFKLPDGTDAFVKKHIKFGDDVYTCAAGRRPVVRNHALKTNLPETPLYSGNASIMVLGEPYLIKTDVTDMETAIASHNAIVYPPRFSTMDMKEPSIYKKLEEMPISW